MKKDKNSIEKDGIPISVYMGKPPYIHIDLRDLIDWYSYHDAPSSVIVPLNQKVAEDIIWIMREYLQRG